jgi:hypothetical protein
MQAAHAQAVVAGTVVALVHTMGAAEHNPPLWGFGRRQKRTVTRPIKK